MNTVNDIRKMLAQSYKNKEFIIDKTGAKVIELIGCTFLADQDNIIRLPNKEYVKREIQWYKSESLYVNDIPGKIPKIWNDISSNSGKINSNYGWCIWSKENCNQYNNVLQELQNNPDSRRAVMIYNRPSMHQDFNENGMNDFICTFANTFFIRNGKLISHYVMRSNDCVYGYCNDFAWAKYVQEKLAKDLGIECGDIIWTASSMHVYERHFKYLNCVV